MPIVIAISGFIFGTLMYQALRYAYNTGKKAGLREGTAKANEEIVRMCDSRVRSITEACQAILGERERPAPPPEVPFDEQPVEQAPAEPEDLAATPEERSRNERIAKFYRESAQLETQLPIDFTNVGKAQLSLVAIKCPRCGNKPNTEDVRGLIGLDPDGTSATMFAAFRCEECPRWVVSAGQIECHPEYKRTGDDFFQIVDRPDLRAPWDPEPDNGERKIDLDD